MPSCVNCMRVAPTIPLRGQAGSPARDIGVKLAHPVTDPQLGEPSVGITEVEAGACLADFVRVLSAISMVKEILRALRDEGSRRCEEARPFQTLIVLAGGAVLDAKAEVAAQFRIRRQRIQEGQTPRDAEFQTLGIRAGNKNPGIQKRWAVEFFVDSNGDAPLPVSIHKPVVRGLVRADAGDAGQGMLQFAAIE